jgi:hypothetical protein
MICVDLRKLNDACLHDPFLTPFTDEVLVYHHQTPVGECH